jgi:hypothetical protein
MQSCDSNTNVIENIFNNTFLFFSNKQDTKAKKIKRNTAKTVVAAAVIVILAFVLIDPYVAHADSATGTRTDNNSTLNSNTTALVLAYDAFRSLQNHAPTEALVNLNSLHTKLSSVVGNSTSPLVLTLNVILEKAISSLQNHDYSTAFVYSNSVYKRLLALPTNTTTTTPNSNNNNNSNRVTTTAGNQTVQNTNTNNSNVMSTRPPNTPSNFTNTAVANGIRTTANTVRLPPLIPLNHTNKTPSITSQTPQASQTSLPEKQQKQQPTLKQKGFGQGFIANGTINSLIYAPLTKWIASGSWSMTVDNGSLTSFETNMTWNNGNGTAHHTHEFRNFRSTEVKAIIIQPDNSVHLKGLMDVGTNHRLVWKNVPTTININGGKTITISVNDKVTNYHFAGQAIYGVVTSLTRCSDQPGPNMEVLPNCNPSLSSPIP